MRERKEGSEKERGKKMMSEDCRFSACSNCF
jgi:hypothetical protein